MKIAVVGSGGREHAILKKLSLDSPAAELLAFPGNGGTSELARNVLCDVTRVDALASALEHEAVDLVIVGPEIPLALGLVNRCRDLGIHCFGPTAAGARLESSKIFAKEVMTSAGVPTASYRVFEGFAEVQDYVKANPGPCVVKADGLAAGKGAFVCDTGLGALAVAERLLIKGELGAAGRRLLLEERLYGEEVSCMYFCDGEHFRALPVARDYKRALDHDRGDNTGGMGSVCPSRQWNAVYAEEVERRIIGPVLRNMAGRGAPYRGILYAGLMLTDQGPYVIEFNCRLGDPETQTILPVWQGNFLEHALACLDQRLDQVPVAESVGYAVCVVLAANGYPATHQSGIEIKLSEKFTNDRGHVLHAGTMVIDGQCVSTGGRVLNAIGIGASPEVARANAYDLAKWLKVPGLRFREDIGK